MKFQKTITAVVLSATLAGCTMTADQRTAIGALSGGAIGGAVGSQVSGTKGAVIGAVLGAVAGGAIGRYMDSQQEKLEKALASSGITVTRINKSTIKLNIPNSVTFAVNKSSLSPRVYGSMNSLATIFNEFDKTAIHVLGFADSTGDANYNVRLSQRRAQSAAGYLSNKGVVNGRLVPVGYGASYPVASNDNASGRAQNRRVEIYIRAIESGKEQSAYAPIY